MDEFTRAVISSLKDHCGAPGWDLDAGDVQVVGSRSNGLILGLFARDRETGETTDRGISRVLVSVETLIVIGVKTLQDSGRRLYRVTDPDHLYPIFRLELVADDPAEAAHMAAEAMMHCSIEDVDEDFVREFLDSLTVEAL
ncbi:MAG: hypothetical protein HQ582_08020 [Planctomycetes bacterium]|nr:hypothetical protein [Planctomycetota bacterium]